VKAPLRLLALLVAAVISIPGVIHAGGMQVSLTTSVYRFVIPADGQVNPREQFTAGASVANLSDANIDFSFPDPASAAQRFKFFLLGPDGTQLWQSEAPDVVAQVVTPLSLKRHGNWRRTATIPLKLAGQWLPAGHYTVRASIAGTPAVDAEAGLEIVWLSQPVNTGIRGQVSRGPDRYYDGTGEAAPADSPLTGVPATVTITELRDANKTYDHPPFSWTGPTDNSGHYQVATPPGNFSVYAISNPPPPAPSVAFPSNVTVTAKNYSSQDIVVPGRLVAAALRSDTGVNGQVVLSDGTPLSGASVQLVVLQPATRLPIGVELPSPSSATTDANGRFQIEAIPGSYRVMVLAALGDDPTPALVADTGITVAWGSFSTTDLTASPTAPPPTPNAQRVDVVTSAFFPLEDLVSTNSFPPSVYGSIVAHATVTGSGWTNPQLVARPSSDSTVVEFDFVAEPPAGSVGSGSQDLRAKISYGFTSGAGRRVLIYSRTNVVEVKWSQVNPNPLAE